MAVRLMMESPSTGIPSEFEHILDGRNLDGDLVGEMVDGLTFVTRLNQNDKIRPFPHRIAHREQTARNVIAGLLSAIVEEIQDRPNGALALSATGRHRSIKEKTNRGLAQTTHSRSAPQTTWQVLTDGHALAQYQRISGMRPF